MPRSARQRHRAGSGHRRLQTYTYGVESDALHDGMDDGYVRASSRKDAIQKVKQAYEKEDAVLPGARIVVRRIHVEEASDMDVPSGAEML